MNEAPPPEVASAEAAADTTPLADGELDGLFAPLAKAPAVALAVSGGADSLVLLDAARRWRERRTTGPALLVLTVDHGLRPSSAAEADGVAAAAGRLGLPCRILRWTAPKPATGIEAAARAARYALLQEAAQEAGATFLLTAHHRDDQAETFLLRLAGGSGVAGLSAMQALRPMVSPLALPGGSGAETGLMLFRPFLALPRARLVATVRDAGLTPAEDETNHDPRYTRARLRRLMPMMEAEGLGAPALARAAARIGRASAALDHYAARLVGEAVSVDALAVARLDRTRYASEPEEVRLRALGRLLSAIGGALMPPATAPLEALDGALTAGHPFRRTLGGAVISAGARRVTLFREEGRGPHAAVPVTAGLDLIWDHRFRVVVESAPEGAIGLAPLGRSGRVAVGAVRTRHPAAALATLPSFRRGEHILAVPPLGIPPPPGSGLRIRTECVLPARIGPDGSGNAAAGL